MGQVTLKDIANALGVSTTSVHRALYNKGGISGELRSKILEEAASLGYKSNYAASALKRHTIIIAVVLPSQKEAGRYYYKYLWDAITDCQEDAESFNVNVITRTYEDSAADHCRVLSQLFKEFGGQLDGLLTLPIRADEQTTNTLNKFCFAGIAIVLFDIDLPFTNRLCCVAPHEYNNGALAAEVLSIITHQKGKVLIAGGSIQNSSHINTIKGFTEYIKNHAIDFEPVVIHGYENIAHCYELAATAFQAHNDIVAFFGGTAREIVPLCRAARDNNLAGKIKGVGNDLFRESAQFLQENILQAVIDKNNYEKGVIGFGALFDYVVKKVKPKNKFLQVPTRLVIKGNLHFYEEGL